MNEPGDVDRAIGVLRLSFEIAREQREHRLTQEMAAR
jgi:hypothetical protein